MTQHTTIDATVRNAALRLLANGDATVAEVAMLVTTSRQRVQYWVDQAGIDIEVARAAKLTRLWQDHLLYPAIERRVTAKRILPKRKIR